MRAAIKSIFCLLVVLTASCAAAEPPIDSPSIPADEGLKDSPSRDSSPAEGDSSSFPSSLSQASSSVFSSSQPTPSSSLVTPSVSSSEPDIEDSGDYVAVFDQGISFPFEASPLGYEEYFLQNYTDFHDVTPLFHPEYDPDDFEAVMASAKYPKDFVCTVSGVPRRFDVFLYKLWQCPRYKIYQQLGNMFLVSTQENEHDLTLTYKYYSGDTRIPGNRFMYLYVLTDGETSYYLGVYSGSDYLEDMSVFDDYIIPAEEIESIYARSFTRYMIEDGNHAVTYEYTFTDDTAKELYAQSFPADYVILGAPIGDYPDMRFTVYLKDGSTKSIRYTPAGYSFIIDNGGYFMRGPFERFAIYVLEYMRANVEPDEVITPINL